MNSALIILQVWSFVRTLVWGIAILGTSGTLIYLIMFKYIIEFNKRTGSGIIIKRKRARKTKDKNGTTVLFTITGKKYNYPENPKYIYKSGFSFLIRYYMITEDNYHPIGLVKGKEDHPYLKPIPQNIKFLYRSDQESIRKKYEARKTMMQQYGQLVGVGALCIAFIFAVYFIMQQVDAAISMGNNVIAQISALKGQMVVAAPPPA